MVGIGPTKIDGLSCSNYCLLEETGVKCTAICPVALDGYPV